MNLLRIFLSCCFLFPYIAFGWWDVAHVAIAEIAYENLDARVKNKVDNLVEPFLKTHSNYSDFVSLATWADDMMNEGLGHYFFTHGSLMPYDPDHLLSKSKYHKLCLKVRAMDVARVLEECVKILKKPKASQEVRGMIFRFFIHLIGDIHTPIHCITLYNADFPNGDTLGCEFLIDSKYHNLHRIVDAGFGLFDVRIKLPLSDGDRRKVREIVSLVRKKYPRKSLEKELCRKNIDQWREESFSIGKNFLYPYVLKHKKISLDFIQEGQDICLKRVALAAYRLEDFLYDIFSVEK